MPSTHASAKGRLRYAAKTPRSSASHYILKTEIVRSSESQVNLYQTTSVMSHETVIYIVTAVIGNRNRNFKMFLKT
jgi:hypothetical protein